MKNKRLLFNVGVLTFAGLFFFSCVNDLDVNNVSTDMLIDHSLVVPIGQGRLTASKVVKQLSQLEEGEEANDAEVYFVVRKSLKTSYNAKELLEKSKNFSGEETIVATGKEADLDGFWDWGVNANPTQERVDSVRFTKVEMAVKVTLDGAPTVVPQDIQLDVDFKGKLRSREAISHTPSQFGQFETIAITDGTVSFVNNDNSPAIGIPVRLKVKYQGAGFTPGTKIKVEIKIIDVDFTIAYVDFAPNYQLVEARGATGLDFAQDERDGRFRFADPVITLKTTSNLGIKMDCILDSLKVYHAGDESSAKFADFQGGTSTSFEIPKPQSIGAEAKGETILNKNHGKIDLLFDASPLPEFLSYKMQTLMGTGPMGSLNYLLADSYMNVDITAKFPLNMKTGSYLKVKDTIKEVSKGLKSLKDYEVDEAVVVLKVWNGMPMQAEIELFFEDSLGTALNNKGLKNRYQIQAPKVFAQSSPREGEVEKIIPQTIEITVDGPQWEMLKKTERILYSLNVDGKSVSGTQEPIHITINDFIELKVGVFLKARTTLKQN